MSFSNAMYAGGTGGSAIRFAMNPTPLGAASLIGGAMLGGKSGGTPFVPGYKDGQYTINDKPWDPAKKFQIQGDQGAFDLVPGLLNVPRESMQDRALRNMTGGQAPDLQKSIYNNARGLLGNDATALSTFDSAFGKNPRGAFGQPKYGGLGGVPVIWGQLGASDVLGKDMNVLSSFAKGRKMPTFTPKA